MEDRPALGPPEREALESAVLALLLQEHRAAMTGALVLDTVGRVLFAGLVLGMGLLSEPSATETLAGLLVSFLVATIWWRSRWRAEWRIRGLEETVNTMTRGSAAQHAYAESRYFLDFRANPLDVLVRFEPAAWLVAILLLLTVNAMSGGGGF
jgi:hypothetical protein